MSDLHIYVGPVIDDAIVNVVRDSGAQIVNDPADATGIVWLGHKPQDLIDVLHDGIKWVQLKAAGVDTWLNAGVLTPDIAWSSARGAYAGPVAEHALTLILAGARRLHESIGQRTWGAPGARFGRV